MGGLVTVAALARGVGGVLVGSRADLPAALPALLGIPTSVVVVAVVALIGVGLLRVPHARPDARLWSPEATGLALGITGLLAWLTGAASGWHWGLSMTGPSRSLVAALLGWSPDALTWGSWMLIGVPLGTWASARAAGPVSWRVPAWGELFRRLAGGALMGVGGTLAAGCNIGNALTGLSILSLHSAMASAAIVTGAGLALATPGILRAVRGLSIVRDRT